VSELVTHVDDNERAQLEAALYELGREQLESQSHEVEKDEQVARQVAVLRDASNRRKILSSYLRACRERASLSQAALAARIGTSQPAVARLEAGLTDPKLSTLERYVAACGAELPFNWGLAFGDDEASPKRVIQAGIDAWNRHDQQAWAAQFSDDVELIAAGLGDTERGMPRVHRFFETWQYAFDDLRVNVVSLTAEGPHVAVEGIFIGRHTRTLRVYPRDIPPTGQSVNSPFSIANTVERGKCTRAVVYYDQLDLMNQLGVRVRVAVPETA
jgi:transcriptional regulator with XRE-family HTH domain